MFTGNYYADGGSFSGPSYLDNSDLYVVASPANPTTIALEGTGDTLETDNLPNTTLWVQANDTEGNATLTVSNGLTNDGTILLQSANVYNSYTDTLALAGSFTNAADGTIQVNPNSGGARSIVLSATTTLTGNLLTNPGAETGNLNGWVVGGSSNPTVDNGSFDPGINPHSGSYDFRGGTGASGSLTQNVQLVGTQGITAAAIDTGTLTASVGFWEQGLNQGSPSDDADVSLAFLAASGAILSTVSTPEVDSHNGSWQQYVTGFTIPVGTRSIDYTIQFIRHVGNDLDAFVDDTSLMVSSEPLVNAGTINFDANTTVGSAGANIINTGLMSLAGATVTVVGSSFTNDFGGLVSGYGTFNTSGVSVTENGIIDLSQPSILGVDLEPSSVAIAYYDTAGMNQASVMNAANYTLIGSGGDGIFGNGNDVNESGLISQVTYSAATETATLMLSSDLPADFYLVEVNGSAVVDTANTPLLSGAQDQVERVLGVVPATANVSLDPASDSGAPANPGYTNVTTPTFDVQVNQAGTIEMDFQGDGTIDATLSAPAAGTYQFTSPTLADGTYTAMATFDSSTGGMTQASTTYAIDTVGPYVDSMSPDSLVSTSVSDVMVTFSELVNLSTFTPSAITFTGPDGSIGVDQPELVSGTTYDIGFGTQFAQGTYTFTIAPTVTDLAGNEMDQDQDGIDGEPDDSFTGTFTIGLPDLAVTATQAPSSALLGASIPVSWTVTNISQTNPAPSAWTDAVYISPDSVLDGSAIPLITVNEPAQSPLEPGASYTSDVSVTIPGNLSVGNDFLLFVANDNRGQLESDAGNDTNDLVAVPISVVAPDLQVTGLSVQPAIPVSGSTIVVNWNDANTGDGATDTGWVDSVSVANTLTGQTLATATVPYDAASLGALQPGGSAAQQFALTLPDGDPGVGTLTITVTTNTTNSVIEGNSTGTAGTNNTATASTTSALADYPDLSVSQVSISPSNPQSGDQVTVNWIDANTGLGSVTQSFDDLVEVENTSTGQTLASATVPYDLTALGSLAAGASSAPGSTRSRSPVGCRELAIFRSR